MITKNAFLNSPFKISHDAYSNSFLFMSPSVEMASGEVLLASTYRAIGSNKKMESRVPAAGSGLLNRIEGKNERTAPTGNAKLKPEEWKTILQDTLRSPKQPNQSARHFLQISPLIPDAALYSLSARLAGNPWNPGDLVKKIVQFGSDSVKDAEILWLSLFDSLKVDENDEVWARFLDQEFKLWRTTENEDYFTSVSDIKPEEAVENWREQGSLSPAGQFCTDLQKLILLKPKLTRRQWITLVESLIRLGASTHTMWLAEQNKLVADLLYNAVTGKPFEKISDKSYRSKPLLKIDQYVSSQIKAAANAYEKSRLKINLLLVYLSEKFGEQYTSNALSSIKNINDFAQKLSSSLTKSELDDLREDLQDLLEEEPKRFQCKTGRSKNIYEFLQHSLQQRQTSEVGLEPYDQGYFLRKSGAHRNARWEVALGPVSVIAIVFCCTQTSYGNANMDDLLDHLGRYGVELDPDNRESSSLVKTLRSLGLVLDSPDAEGGMALVPPFNVLKSEEIN